MAHEKELIELLDKETTARECEKDLLAEQQKAIENAFSSFGMRGNVVHATNAPQVNCFELAVENGEKLKSSQSIKEKIETMLGERNIRMLPPMPGRSEFRLEIPNGKWADVAAGEVFGSEVWTKSHATLPLMLGKDVEGNTTILDLEKAPHLLIAGCTGTGKSIFMDSCLCSLMFKHTPDELKLILADPKVVEFTRYENIPYLQFPVINSSKDVLMALQWLAMEMEHRFEILSKAGARNIKALNELHPGALPYIIMVIDELADFMLESRSQMVSFLSRICSMSRAVGIHIIISTQRPDSSVLTECIKANFPTRIAFRMASQIDSRTLIDSYDAAFLVGRGDMLFRGPCGEALTHIQCPFVKPQESARIVEWLQVKYKDMKPNELASLRDLATDRQDTALRDRLVEIISGTLCETIDYDDDILGVAVDKVADAIIKHLDELQEIQESTMECNKDSQKGTVAVPQYSNDELSPEVSEMLQKAIKIVIESRRPLISYIQRMLGIGYNRAWTLMKAMERFGIVSPQPDNGPRSILVDTYEEAISRLPKQNLLDRFAPILS